MSKNNKTCKFVSKNLNTRCENTNISSFGFCPDHVKTLQGRIAKSQQDEQKSTENITIKRNSFGRFEDPTTHIVFDARSQKAYGVQGVYGDLLPLTQKHVDICNSKGWKVLSRDAYY